MGDNVNTTEVQEVSNTTEVQETVTPIEGQESKTPENVEGSENTDISDDPDKSENSGDIPSNEGEVDAELQFMDLQFTLDDIEVSEDLTNGLKDAGFELKDLAKELYTGEFGLSEDTLGKLYEKFPKYVVDATLKAIKTSNEGTIKSINEHQEGLKQAAESAWKETLEIVGSEENWDKLTVWAGENLSDEEYDAVNEVMEGSNWTIQKLVIESLYKKSGLDPVKPENPSLDVTDLTSKVGNEEGPMSYDEYNKLWASGEYGKLPKEEQNAIDVRRRKGIELGI